VRAVVTLLGVLLVAFGVWASGYGGRVDLHDSQIRACERGKLDRAANARGWRRQAHADQMIADDPFQSARTRAVRRASARVYRGIASDLEARARLDCNAVVKPPRILPSLGVAR
jgi:hypothetical protein